MHPLNVKPSFVLPSPEEDDVKADIIMVLQSPSTGQRTVGEKKKHSTLNQKIRNTRALPADVTVVQVNGKYVDYHVIRMFCVAVNSLVIPMLSNAKKSHGKNFKLKMRHFKFVLLSDESKSDISH